MIPEDMKHLFRETEENFFDQNGFSSNKGQKLKM